jgi:hypothetical protein
VKPLLEYFGKNRINDVEAKDMERYRELRRKQGRMDWTISIWEYSTRKTELGAQYRYQHG